MLSLRMRHLEMDNTILDMVVSAQIQSYTVGKKLKSKKKKKCHCLDYYYEGHKICSDTCIKYVHAVFKDCLAVLVQQYLQNDVTPRMNGNKGKLPKHALDVNDIERVVTFIHNYAEENAVLLPGRIP